MTARPVFAVSGAKAAGDVPTVQANGSVAWATPSGGAQPAMTLMGPYTVTHASPDVDGALGFPLFDVVAGTILWQFFPRITAAFDSGTNMQIVDDTNSQLAFEVVVDAVSFVGVFFSDIAPNNSLVPTNPPGGNINVYTGGTPVIVNSDTQLRAWITQPSAGGSLDAYFLIKAPM